MNTPEAHHEQMALSMTIEAAFTSIKTLALRTLNDHEFELAQGAYREGVGMEVAYSNYFPVAAIENQEPLIVGEFQIHDTIGVVYIPPGPISEVPQATLHLECVDTAEYEGIKYEIRGTPGSLALQKSIELPYLPGYRTHFLLSDDEKAWQSEIHSRKTDLPEMTRVLKLLYALE